MLAFLSTYIGGLRRLSGCWIPAMAILPILSADGRRGYQAGKIIIYLTNFRNETWKYL